MVLRNSLNIKSEQQPYHLVDNSPWPIVSSLSLFLLVIYFILYFHYYTCWHSLLDCLLLFFIALHRWFYDIIIEATFEGKHTKKVRQGIKLGMALFILSEIMFFCSFFCSFFYYYFSSSMWGGGNFPSPSLYKLSPWGLPLLNTVLLLSSGVSLTLGHKSILLQKKSEFKDSLCFTIFYGFLFLSIQLFEYKNTVLSINDSVYGSIFYLTTGFHGIHVLVGAIFLVICLLRFLRKHFVMGQHVGFECSVWYWHFVDAVWLFLFFILYF